MGKRPWLGIIGAALLFGETPAFCGEEIKKQYVFETEEVSVLDLNLKKRENQLQDGQRGECSLESDAAVRDYPDFVSQSPLYGSVRFGAEIDNADSGELYSFALDETGGTGTGYDRLYFDLNGDIDLTNDVSVRRMPMIPKAVKTNSASILQEACFECLHVKFPLEEGTNRIVEILPTLRIFAKGCRYVHFLATEGRTCNIEIEGESFGVFMGDDKEIAGRFDRKDTGLLFRFNPTPKMAWQRNDLLMALHQIGDHFYEFSATPTGNRLIATRYEGPMGVLQIGSGERDISEMDMRGIARSKDHVVPIREIQDNWPMCTRRCELPVGDYLLEDLTVNFGSLFIQLSDNWHADGERQGKLLDPIGYPPNHGVQIREGKPFVFDFSNPPEAFFVLPSTESIVHPGEELEVMAVLVDPKLDFMIYRLERKHPGEKTDKRNDAPRDGVSLDPKVSIRRASGETVAEGLMPFG